MSGSSSLPRPYPDVSAHESPAPRFEQLVRALLANAGFEIVEQGRLGPDAGFDFLAQRNDERWVIEVKFYRTERPQLSLVETAAALLAAAAANQEATRGLLVLSATLTEAQRDSLAERYGLVLMDRWDLLELAQLHPDLFDSLVGLFDGAEGDIGRARGRTAREAIEHPWRWPTPGAALRRDSRGASLCRELRSMDRGTGAWRQYEQLCERILRYLFPAGLHGWHKQKRSGDGLNRFDFICRVTPDAEFWRFVVQEVNSRYILFEFKNYALPIKQGQVLTTEKYLLERGLRRVAIILSRKGASESAIKMTQGAMREHGKLILVLDDDQVCQMLHMKQRGEDPTDLLFELADDFLLGLPR